MVSYDEIFNPINGKLEPLIDLFTEYFGDKYKGKISDNLHNTEFFFLDKNPVETLKRFYNSKILDMLADYRKSIGLAHLNLTVEDYKQMLIAVIVGDIGTNEFLNICEVSASIGLDVFAYNDINDFLSYSSNTNKLVAKLNKCIDTWKEHYEQSYYALIDEYSKYSEPYVEGQEELDNIEDYYENQIDHIYLEQLDKYLVCRDDISFQQFFTYKRLLQSAVSIGQENLNSDFIVDKALLHQFMDFFGALGFYHGSDFDAYVNDPKLQAILFDKDMLDSIYALKKEKFVTSFMHNQQFLDAARRIDSVDSKSGSYNMLASICMYLSSTHMGGFTQAHLTRDNKLKHYCVCPLGAGLSDNTFIHEAGHAAAGSIVSIMPDKFVDKSGIDTSTIDISKLEFSFDTLVDRVKVTNSKEGMSQAHRKYHILNEVIHDYLIQDILKLAKAKGVTFGLIDNESSKTQYSYAFPLVKDFIERYKPFLKDCIMSDDPDLLARFMGRENLDLLAAIVERCVNMPDNVRSSALNEIAYHYDIDSVSMFDVARDTNTRWSKHTHTYLDLYAKANDIYTAVQSKDGM